jgi:hypothetical protein
MNQLSSIADDDVGDDEVLLRRFAQCHLIEEKFGVFRVSSAGFASSSDGSGMSVDLKSELERQGLPVTHVLTSFPNQGLAQILASDVRQLELQVIRTPLPDNTAHANVVGSFTKSIQKKLAAKAVIIQMPG